MNTEEMLQEKLVKIAKLMFQGREDELIGNLHIVLTHKLAEETRRDPVEFSLEGALAHLGSTIYYKYANDRMISEGLSSYRELVNTGTISAKAPLASGNGAMKLAAAVEAAMHAGTQEEVDIAAGLLKRAAAAEVFDMKMEKRSNWKARGAEFLGSGFGKGLTTAAGASAVAAPVALGVGAHLRDTSLQQAEDRTNNVVRNAALVGTGATLATMVGKKMIDRALPDRPNVQALTGHVANNVTPMAQAANNW